MATLSNTIDYQLNRWFFNGLTEGQDYNITYLGDNKFIAELLNNKQWPITKNIFQHNGPNISRIDNGVIMFNHNLYRSASIQIIAETTKQLTYKITNNPV